MVTMTRVDGTERNQKPETRNQKEKLLTRTFDLQAIALGSDSFQIDIKHHYISCLPICFL